MTDDDQSPKPLALGRCGSDISKAGESQRQFPVSFSLADKLP